MSNHGPSINAAGDRPRFLSEADCHAIAQRIARIADGGVTAVTIWSRWIGNVRWARNLISTSGEVRNNYIKIVRDLRGAANGWMLFNDTTDAGLVAAVRRAERLARLEPEVPGWNLIEQEDWESGATSPQLFSEATYQMDAEHRAAAAIVLSKAAADAGMLSAGYLEVSAHSLAVIDSLGHTRYFPYTSASYSATVRDPTGSGSGWAGVDWSDWSRIDGQKLSAIALDKCLRSRNPVAVEPGRYTAILEPQAVADFVGSLQLKMDRECADSADGCWPRSPFSDMEMSKKKSISFSKMGEKIVDERITLSSDPMDPELGFPPFREGYREGWWQKTDWLQMEVYHPTTWIDHGVLTQLSYDRAFGNSELGLGTGLPFEGAFRMSGGETSLDEMIATTQRGLLVTCFDRVGVLDDTSLLVRGYTRNGLWLVEHGKISKPVKNMIFTESIFFALNNIEQLGVPQRVYSSMSNIIDVPKPRVVPPLKVKDFSFTALTDAI